jgi:NitT/TauT family transport system substrate-binding protein
MKKLVLESTAPFQGLAELIASDEGLFEKEGVQVEWIDRDETALRPVASLTSDVKEANPFSSHGKLLEQGKADMYNACEWGNYQRVSDTGVKSRQLGRRAIVTFAAIVVRPDSPVYNAAQLANRTVGVPFYAGTHYLALHLLEGFIARDQINVVRAPQGSRTRMDLMMKGEVEATTLTEPYLTLAEKKGCRIICSASFFGTEVASDRVDEETYSAFNRAVRAAVALFNADKSKYMHYFIDYHKRKDPEIGELKVSDLRESRIVLRDPAPIPLEELQRTYEWIKGWGMLEDAASHLDLVDLEVMHSKQAHLEPVLQT